MISALSSLRERFPSCSLAWTGWASSKLVGLVAKSFSAPVASEAELLFQEAASFAKSRSCRNTAVASITGSPNFIIYFFSLYFLYFIFLDGSPVQEACPLQAKLSHLELCGLQQI